VVALVAGGALVAGVTLVAGGAPRALAAPRSGHPLSEMFAPRAPASDKETDEAKDERARDRREQDLSRPETIEGPVDRAQYILGPGDRLAVTLSGAVQRAQETLVTAEGTLLVPPAVGLRVAGLTIDGAQDALRDALKPFYRGVDVRLDLVEVRRFEVYVLGAVERPGNYTAHGATRVSTVLDEAGNVSAKGSWRTIRVERGDGSAVRVDLVAFYILGERSANPFLQDGDRVIVPFAGERAVLHGSVGRPGDYEILEGETIADIIRLAGGTMPGADRSRLQLRRFRGPSDPETEAITVDLDGPGASTPAIAGDQITVYTIPDWHIRRPVEVRGEVRYPGVYVIDEGRETLAGVIERAGGFTPDASVHEATLTRAIGIIIVDPEFERLKQIDVGDMTRDEYEYFKLRSREHAGRVVVDFEAFFLRGQSAEDVPLRRGDVIDVPTATEAVKVAGQVASPGAIAFDEGKPVKWYIERAGGYGWRAAKGKTRVITGRTGEWISAKKAKRLEPGDTIWVPEKPERKYWEMFKDGLALTGQVLTIYLVIDRISN